MTERPWLRSSAWLLAAGSIVHGADHFRRGWSSITVEVWLLGSVGSLLTILSVVAVLRGHRRAPELAAAVGLSLAAGFVAVHWLPGWGVLSDSLVDGDAAGFSMFASLLEIAGGLALGLAGLYAWHAAGRTPASLGGPS